MAARPADVLSAAVADVVDNTMDAKELKPGAFTKPYLDFMTENPTVFHAVGYFEEKLCKAGYSEVRLRTAVGCRDQRNCINCMQLTC